MTLLEAQRQVASRGPPCASLLSGRCGPVATHGARPVSRTKCHCLFAGLSATDADGDFVLPEFMVDSIVRPHFSGPEIRVSTGPVGTIAVRSRRSKTRHLMSRLSSPFQEIPPPPRCCDAGRAGERRGCAVSQQRAWSESRGGGRTSLGMHEPFRPRLGHRSIRPGRTFSLTAAEGWSESVFGCASLRQARKVFPSIQRIACSRLRARDWSQGSEGRQCPAPACDGSCQAPAAGVAGVEKVWRWPLPPLGGSGLGAASEGFP